MPEEVRGKCSGCGGSEGSISTVLTEEQWLQIHPRQDEYCETLCANCIVERAAKLPHIISVGLKLIFADDYNDDEHPVKAFVNSSSVQG